jgi:cell division septal protein FtsQ
MARRNTRVTTKRASPAKPRARSRTRRKKPFVLRWYHLLIACIATFCLGYLVAFGHATRYVSTVAGLR